MSMPKTKLPLNVENVVKYASSSQGAAFYPTPL